MFTGIVQGKAEVTAIAGAERLKTFTVKFPQNSLDNISHGASIAINGVCLTVTQFDLTNSTALFDVMQETLEVTSLDLISKGDKVNFERAASIGAEIGGHLMSGHIHVTCTVSKLEKHEDGNVTLFFTTPTDYKKYLLPKGFVGLNGCSLTLGSIVNTSFSVHLIPETLNITTFGSLKTGDVINLEVDPQTQAIVDTVERYLGANKISQ